MSSSTRPPDPGLVPVAAAARQDAVLLWSRLALAGAYPLLAHLASARQDDVLAALALVDIAVVVLLAPLLRRRVGAWALLAACIAGAWWLAGTRHALLPLLLVPVAFVALVAWGFGRTLRGGQVPLIGRIVAALEGVAHPALAPELRSYTRSLTLAWTLLLATLALCNLGLALLAVPGGLMARVGIAAPLAVSQAQWSWFANISDYGIVGGFMLLEYAYRKRRFPGRYHSFLDFLQRMARLGPAFWRDLLH
jgi:uncharacterized membrane protein